MKILKPAPKLPRDQYVIDQISGMCAASLPNSIERLMMKCYIYMRVMNLPPVKVAALVDIHPGHVKDYAQRAVKIFGLRHRSQLNNSYNTLLGQIETLVTRQQMKRHRNEVKACQTRLTQTLNNTAIWKQTN
tara:strand:+ start:24 stop:419 length:396 start_codon:yes stop_codon:yes gene_type:complete